MPLDLTIILISHNELHYIKPCLASLEETAAIDGVQVIWVDNGSVDGSSEWVSDYYPQVRQIRLPKNRGVAYARNRGMEEAYSKYILFLDIDTVANTEAIRALYDFLEKRPQTGLCGCQLKSEDNVIQESYKKFPVPRQKANNLGIAIAKKFHLASIAHYLEKKNSVYSYAPPRQDVPFSPDYLIGACQMFRRELITKIGKLDENIFYGPEDADFCFRIRQAGYTVNYLPNYAITHHFQRATSRNPFSVLSLKHTWGLIYYWYIRKQGRK